MKGVLFLLGLAGPALAESPPTDVVAVLPVHVSVPEVTPSLADVLTASLASHLSEGGGFRVVTSRELEDVARVESYRQGLGCADDEACWVELAGAAGAARVLNGEVNGTRSLLLWTETLVDTRSGTVAARAQVKGRDGGELLAQAGEMALQLLGRASEASLDGPAARRYLGLADDEAVAEFKRYRALHADQGTAEAFTSFILQRNLESRAMGVAQVVLLSAPGVLFPAAALLSLFAAQPVLAGSAAGHEVRPWDLALQGVSVALALGAFASLATGIVLLVVDVLNPGRVKVASSGCCRKEEDLQDAQRRERRLHRMMSMVPPVVALAGFLLCATGSVLILGGAVRQDFGGYPTPAVRVGWSNTALITSVACVLGAAWCLPPALACAMCASFLGAAGSGAAIYLTAQPPLVDDVDEQTAPEASR